MVEVLEQLKYPCAIPTPDATRDAQSTCIIALPMLEVDRPFSNQEFNMVGAWAVTQRTSKKNKQTKKQRNKKTNKQINKQLSKLGGGRMSTCPRQYGIRKVVSLS